MIDFFAERFLRALALEVSATAVKTRRWGAWRTLPVAAAVASVILFGPLRHAQAQAPVHDYPSRSIRVLVGASAGDEGAQDAGAGSGLHLSHGSLIQTACHVKICPQGRDVIP